MRKIKVNYAGWWEGFNPDTYLINQILRKYYDLEISDKPDYVFCSLYSNEFLKYDGIRIFYTGENIVPDFNLFDYCIGFDEIVFGDRYLRVPNYIMNPKYANDLELMCKKHLTENNTDRKFCGFVCSNGNADLMRNKIYEEVSKYKWVASGGRYLNNIGLPNGVDSKLDFQKQFKFSLALENTSFKGYTTEKLVEAFAAGGVPIYWGDPEVKRYFNEKAFINILDYPTLLDAVEEIKRIDRNSDIYMEYIKTPALIDLQHIERTKRGLEDFLINIIEQPLTQAGRRNCGIWGRQLTNIVENGTKSGEMIKENTVKKMCGKLKDFLWVKF